MRGVDSLRLEGIYENESALPESNRAASRHARLAYSADAAVGATTRLRHHPSHPHQLRRGTAGRHGLPLSGPTPPRTEEVDQFGVEGLGTQSAGQGLPPDGRGQKATGL